MNYRHAFHAGNFADCFKHALLLALVDTMLRKASPFFVIDTHAGGGRYDLEGEAALRTGEASKGIRILAHSQAPVLQRYLETVQCLGLYPGSPSLIRTLLRPVDRLACCELHPEEVQSLRRHFFRDQQVAVHHRSGWEALSALLPPREKRGLIFIDPPFENDDEFSRLADGLFRGHRRFAHGIFAAWYPIKQVSSVRDFLAALRRSAIRDIVAIELYLREAVSPERLNGCGLIVINPPFGFEHQGSAIANAVLSGLGADENGARTEILRITDE